MASTRFYVPSSLILRIPCLWNSGNFSGSSLLITRLTPVARGQSNSSEWRANGWAVGATTLVCGWRVRCVTTGTRMRIPAWHFCSSEAGLRSRIVRANRRATAWRRSTPPSRVSSGPRNEIHGTGTLARSAKRIPWASWTLGRIRTSMVSETAALSGSRVGGTGPNTSPRLQTSLRA